MRRIHRHPALTALVGGVMAAALVVGGAALAQSGDPTALTACLKGGELYAVAIGEAPLTPCKPGDAQVSWNSEGQPGATWLSGPDTPTNSLGSEGDLYLHLPSGDVFVKESGTWVTRANLAGPEGPQGPQGPTGPQGEQGLAAQAKAVVTNVELNPIDGNTEGVQLIAPQEGKVFHGHINGDLAGPEGTTGTFTCSTAGFFGVDLSADPSVGLRSANSDFACTELNVTATDKADGTDVGGTRIVTVTIFFETSDLTVVP